MSHIESLGEIQTYHLNRPDERPACDKFMACILSIFNELKYFFETIMCALHEHYYGTPAEYVSTDTYQFQWDEGNRGLFILIHGLNGNPNIWQRQLSQLRSKGYEIRIPHVHLKGNCPIKDAVLPILNMAKDYAANHPEKPICIMGVSNGGRIVLDVEYQLRQEHYNPVKASIVAGAILGTKKMDLLYSLGLERLYHRAVVSDLAYLSEDVRIRIDRIREQLPANLIRSFDFYASTEDSQIAPYTASLPNLNQGEAHFIVHGVNHNSIVPSVSEEQVARCLEWTQAYSNN